MPPTSPQNIDSSKHGKHFLTRLFIAVLLFLYSGVLSSYLYYQFQTTGGVFFPGLLYTSSTLILFVIINQLPKTRKLLIYYLLMNLTYLTLLFLTFLSGYFSSLVGIVIAGTGAILTFMLTDKYIVRIKYNKLILFLLGGMSFLITDLLYYIFSARFEQTPLERIFHANVTPSSIFSEVFVFWQTIIGIKLYLTIHKASSMIGK
jgi:hypothetical protein